MHIKNLVTVIFCIVSIVYTAKANTSTTLNREEVRSLVMKELSVDDESSDDEIDLHTLANEINLIVKNKGSISSEQEIIAVRSLLVKHALRLKKLISMTKSASTTLTQQSKSLFEYQKANLELLLNVIPTLIAEENRKTSLSIGQIHNAASAK